MPEHVADTVGANLRSFRWKCDSSGRPIPLSHALRQRPALVIYLFAKHGTGALRTWPVQRRAQQASQQRWSTQRERRAAGACRREFGGVPSVKALYASQDPDIRALPQYLDRSGQSLDDFANRYSLERRLKRRPNGFWRAMAGRCLSRNTYLALCRKTGRFVSRHDLSRRIKIPLADGTGEISALTLHGAICQAFGDERALAEVLIERRELPESWRRQLRTPTANDGTALDSYAEVHYYETFRHAQQQLPEGHPGRSLTLTVHPIIEGSNRISDFRIGDFYIEVLRHPLDSLRNTDTQSQDAWKYSKYFAKRLAAIELAGQRCLVVEPADLSDGDWLRTHFSWLIEAVNRMPAPIAKFKVNAGHPPGYWYSALNRDTAACNTIESLLGRMRSGAQAPLRFHRAGRYPSHQELDERGFGGMVAHLRRARDLDRQTEALRVHTVAVTAYLHRQTDLRRPSRAEWISVLSYHAKRWDRANGFSGSEYKSLHGRVALDWLIDEFGSIKHANSEIRRRLSGPPAEAS